MKRRRTKLSSSQPMVVFIPPSPSGRDCQHGDLVETTYTDGIDLLIAVHRLVGCNDADCSGHLEFVAGDKPRDDQHYELVNRRLMDQPSN